MSHEATNWAFDQAAKFPDMKPGEWAVLVILADCHNPVHGCFPSQQYIAKRINLDARSVRRHLLKLRSRKLLNWCEKSPTGPNLFNRYRMAFEDGFIPYEPEQETEETPDKMSSVNSDNTGQKCTETPDKNDTKHRTKCPPNHVIEPVRGTSNSHSNNSDTENNSTIPPDCPSGDEPSTLPGLPVEAKFRPHSEQGFAQFWEAFADKRGRQAALKVWKRKNLARIPGQVIAGAYRYVANRGPDPRYWKQAQGWLGDGRWEDEPPESAASNSDMSWEDAARAAVSDRRGTVIDGASYRHVSPETPADEITDQSDEPERRRSHGR
jgi:hypothetical protein